MKLKSNAGFTLVELLTVLVIISIVVGIGISGTMAINRAGALRQGTRQFANHVSMARTSSITEGKAVMIVIPKGSATNGLISYGFAITAEPFAAQPQPTNYVDEIQFLPKGIVFDDSAAVLSDGKVGFLDVRESTLPFPEINSAPVAAWVVVFSSYGHVVPVEKCRPSIVLHEGFVDGSGVSRYKGAQTNNNYRVTINGLIGKPSVTQF